MRGSASSAGATARDFIIVYVAELVQHDLLLSLPVRQGAGEGGRVGGVDKGTQTGIFFSF